MIDRYSRPAMKKVWSDVALRSQSRKPLKSCVRVYVIWSFFHEMKTAEVYDTFQVEMSHAVIPELMDISASLTKTIG